MNTRLNENAPHGLTKRISTRRTWERLRFYSTWWAFAHVCTASNINRLIFLLNSHIFNHTHTRHSLCWGVDPIVIKDLQRLNWIFLYRCWLENHYYRQNSYHNIYTLWSTAGTGITRCLAARVNHTLRFAWRAKCTPYRGLKLNNISGL